VVHAYNLAFGRQRQKDQEFEASWASVRPCLKRQIHTYINTHVYVYTHTHTHTHMGSQVKDS
jgi:hypothetical protein